MAFRDLLAGATEINDKISVNHDMLNHSKSIDHKAIVFNNISEAKGLRSAINVLARDRLCSIFDITPGELIDILAWAMENPQEPEMPSPENSPVFENTQEVTDLTKIPIPWHYPEDRGRYQSASVIIAEYDGIRNMSFHRQFLRDGNHCVSRFVPRHLRTMTDKARENGDEINIAVVNGPDATVLLAAAMSFTHDLDELTVAAALHQRLHGKPLELVSLPNGIQVPACLLYTSPSPRDAHESRMPSSA